LAGIYIKNIAKKVKTRLNTMRNAFKCWLFLRKSILLVDKLRRSSMFIRRSV
jgi:hypothetical protein